MDNLGMLRQLTESLPAIRDVDAQAVEFVLESGIHIMWRLWKGPEGKACVVRATVSRGLSFPQHVHEGHETLVFYEGRGEICLDDGTTIEMNAPAAYHIPPGVPHQISYHTNARVIAVLIPCDPGVWPDA